ncbi:MAG TPA: hypothetical protein VGU01_04225 [Sphingomicrobium sp.]|nr:hypothetical protein [Sphingomicrobium sp.]
MTHRHWVYRDTLELVLLCRRWGMGVLASLFLCSRAVAAPEEIQVYMDELNQPGDVGLDIHNNYVLSGGSGIGYEGEQPSLHRYRLTPEWSLGLTHSLELGAYLPLATIGHGDLFVQGFKVRLKWVAPKIAGRNWFWGANFEMGREDHRLDENPWNAELKGIVGVHSGKWTAAANANIDFKVSGPAPAPATLEIATKLSYAISSHTALGIENYNGSGKIRRIGQFESSEQSTYFTADTSVGKWDLNLGLGHGYGSNSDRWIAKAIVSVPLDWSMSRYRRPQ